MHPCTRVLLAASLLLASASTARATGYYVVAENDHEGVSFLGYQGLSTTPHYFPNITDGFDNNVYMALNDFNGDGVPELVVTSNYWTSVEVLDFNTNTVLASFSLGALSGNFRGGSISISGDTITVQPTLVSTSLPSQTFTFTYDPDGDPKPSIALDPDIVSYTAAPFSGGNVVLTNGTAFSVPIGGAPYAWGAQITKWSPSLSAATAMTPEPASLTLLSLAAIPLLRRRKI